LLAYPIGGARGASTGTFIACTAGLVVLVRARRFALVILCLAPFALNFVAAALHRYPYGGHQKFSVYISAVICLLAGLGGASILSWLPRRRPGTYTRVLVASTILVSVAIGSMARDLWRPYKTRSDLHARSFAQWFYFSAEFEEGVVCIKTDLKQQFQPQTDHELSWEATYLCNQRIYSRRHARGEPFRFDNSDERPLLCILYRVKDLDFDEEAFQRWIARMESGDFEGMTSSYELADGYPNKYAFPRYDKRERNVLTVDHVEIYRFLPKPRERVGAKP